MEESYADKLLDQAYTANLRCEDILVAVNGAVFGYIGKDFALAKDSVYSPIELVALLFFCWSFWLTLYLMREAYMLKLTNAIALRISEERKSLESYNGKGVMKEFQTGHILENAEAIRAKWEELKKREVEGFKDIEKRNIDDRKVQKRRTVILFIGFFTLFLSKMIRAYIG